MRCVTTILFFAVAASGCAGNKKNAKKAKTLVVPDSATMQPRYQPDGSLPAHRYVVRMSDGYRDWEVEFPEVAGAYEVRIPLDGKQASGDAVQWGSHVLTDADKKLLRKLRRDHPDVEREGIFADGESVLEPGEQPETSENEPEKPEKPEKPESERSEADAAPSRPSYLLGVEEVNELFTSGNYELALVRVVALERSYPDDVKLLSMEGTLWLKLGKAQLAREAWEKALQIEPDNATIIRALKRL